VDGYWSLYRAENIADAKIWGAELSAHLDLGQFVPHSDGFSLALVAGKSRGTAKNKEGQKTGMNSVQPEKGSLTFAYDDPNKAFGLGLTATAVGAKTAARDASTFQTATTPNYKKVAGYSVFDLAGYWNVNKSTKLNLAVNNIFDKTYWNYASVGTLDADSKASIIDRAAEPGRNIVASVEFKY
jgi:hemoglobin/transferrin/lactoferrin receptor protein